MIQRTNIGIFGKINAGKSTLMNVLTQQNTSIVDSKFGTTTDIKVSLMEIHSLGPVKLFDTAGIDEKGNLGIKKKKKTLYCLKSCDLILIIINPSYSFEENNQIIKLCKKYKKSLILIINEFHNQNNSNLINENSFPIISLDITKKFAKNKIIDFILKNYKSTKKQNLLFSHIQNDDIVFLNIPMDEETPEKRLLRPQAFVQELLLRRFISTYAYRMDLKKARSQNKKEQQHEKKRFQKILFLFKKIKKFKLIITDSQAIDVIHNWTLDNQKQPFIDITTFSIIMSYLKGDLHLFIDGIKALKTLKENDKILIAEACNHNRIKEDIGSFQIPNKIDQYFGKNKIQIDYCFGRDFSSYNLKKYKLIIHCGGCMLDEQSMKARIQDLKDSKTPITNYGLVLSFFESSKAFSRVIRPFNLNIK